jgi:hypothetical protein
MKRKHTITTGSYDMRGHSIWRVLFQDVISRTLPFGNFGGGPNLKYIARLLVLHIVGRPLVYLLIRWRHGVRG